MKNKILAALSLFLFSPFLGSSSKNQHLAPDDPFISHLEIKPGQGVGITRKFGFFYDIKEYRDESRSEGRWRLKFSFLSSKSITLQIRVYYSVQLGPTFHDWKLETRPTKLAFINSYVQFTKGHPGKYDISLQSIEDNMSFFTRREKAMNHVFAIGFYADPSTDDSSRGTYYYMIFPRVMPLKEGNYRNYLPNDDTYAIHPFLAPDLEEIKDIKITKIGGAFWDLQVKGIWTGYYKNLERFNFYKGTDIKGPTIDLPLRMRLIDFDAHYCPLICQDPYLTIEKGRELFNFGNDENYKIPLKIQFDGADTYFEFKENYYLSADGRRVYDAKTLPSPPNNCREIKGLPLPAIKGGEQVFRFKFNLIGCGISGLLKIYGEYAIRKTGNSFGTHHDSDYYVEEIIQ